MELHPNPLATEEPEGKDKPATETGEASLFWVDYFLDRFAEETFEDEADFDPNDPAAAFPVRRAVYAAKHFARLLARHQRELAHRPGLVGILASRAWWLAGETPETLSQRGRSMLAARGGRARMRKAREQGIDLQAMAIAARKRNARQRREAAKGTAAG